MWIINLCNSSGVEPEKVFLHNLRHLFARTYYRMEKDLSRLEEYLLGNMHRKSGRRRRGTYWAKKLRTSEPPRQPASICAIV